MKNIGQIIAKFHYTKINFKNFLLCLPLFLILFVPYLFYSLVINFKNFLYTFGVKKEEEINGIKVICIGNLTTGGVGKTPVVIEFAKYLSKIKKTAILSRGYKGKLKGANVVKDFDKILIEDVELTGDEVSLIANSTTNTSIITSSNRPLGAKRAKELGAEIVLMDDGFSNRKLKKDLSLALFDVEKFIGNGFLLPLGPLREHLGEIKRADGIIIVDKNGNCDDKIEELKKRLEKYKKPVFVAKFEADYYYNIQTGEKLEANKTLEVCAFCAIGQPEQFFSLVQKDFNLKTKHSFIDHFKYTKEKIEKIKASGAETLITTEKDAVKLKGIIKEDDKIFALKLKADIDVQEILTKIWSLGNEIK